jgi:thiol:disulfide interchange protein DsbA
VQKMYFALEVMDKSVVLHKKVFDAIHIDHASIKSDEAVILLAERLGLDRKQFELAYFSPEVLAKVKYAKKLQMDYEIDQVPLVAVGGRYLTSPATAAEMVGDDKPLSGLESISVKILDDLLAK